MMPDVSPVPGFRYRDFIDLMRLRDGLPGQPEPPAAVLESVVATVTLEEPISGGTSVARTSPAELRLSVRQVKPGWVSVPVDLQGFLIGGPPVHEGPGKMFFAAAVVSCHSGARGAAHRRDFRWRSGGVIRIERHGRSHGSPGNGLAG